MTHRYPLDSDQLPSEGVYFVVAKIKDVSPLDLPPLAESINPDALDQLLADTSSLVEIVFTYCQYEIVATPGEICVKPLDTE